MIIPVTMASSGIGEAEKRNVNDVLDSGWLSRHKYIPLFEEQVAARHGAKYGVMVNSGTDALRIGLAVLKEREGWRDGDKIIVPALTFVATANAVLANNLDVMFSDVDLETGNLTWRDWETSGAVGMIPVHLFGLPAPIGDTDLAVVEDSCETFGVHRLLGRMMALSFYMSHPVATGVGGMLLTNDEADASVARSLMNHGRIDDGSHFQFGRLGSSSRVTELEAAIGVGALERYDENLAKRRDIALWYDKALESANVERVNRERHGTHGFMFYPIRVPWGREELMGVLRRAGMESREAMPLINQPVYRETYEKGPRCPNAEIWTKNGLLLPLHPQMTADDVGRVCETVERFYK